MIDSTKYKEIIDEQFIKDNQFFIFKQVILIFI